MKWISVALLTVSLWTTSVAQQWIDQFYPEPLFYIKPQDAEKLTYYEIVDAFDSVKVGCTIGEFRLIVDSTTLRVIPIRSAEIPEEGISGITVPGLDTFLLDFMQTDTFTIPQNATLFFYRALERAFPFVPVPLDSGLSIPHWTDAFWVTPPQWIQDTLIFVIELRRASDHALLMVFDSVGLFPNASSFIHVRFGTEPDQMGHFRQLPNSLAGTKAYIQIKSYRYGPTPYGVHLFAYTSWCSLSTLFEYDSLGIEEDRGTWRGDEAGIDSLFHASYRQLRAYLDPVLAATGKLPLHFAFLPDSALYADYQQRYGQYQFSPIIPWVVVDTIWGNSATATTIVPPAPNWYPFSQQGTPRILRFTITQLRSTKLPTLQITITASQPLPDIALVLYNSIGQQFGVVWTGNLNPGKNVIQASLPQPLANGSYFLVAVDSSDHILGIQTFRLQR